MFNISDRAYINRRVNNVDTKSTVLGDCQFLDNSVIRSKFLLYFVWFIYLTAYKLLMVI